MKLSFKWPTFEMGLAKLTFDCRHGLIKFCSDPLETRGGCGGWGMGGGGNLGFFFRVGMCRWDPGTYTRASSVQFC